MYESFFALSRRPFPSVAEPFFYYPGEAIEDARVVINRCLHRGEGTAMVVGPAGTGKTMLARVLADELEHRFRVVFLETGRFPSLSDMLGTILHRLGRSHGGRHETDLHLELTDILLDRSESENGTVLIIDESHGLTLSQIEELRVLTNLSADGAPRLRLLLVGAARLEERLAHPKLASFSQGIVARGYLESLGRVDTAGLIARQFEAAGGDAQAAFPKSTCDAFYRATDGIPRLINQVCDLSLLRAAAEERPSITEFDVERAWAELQQLPTPWNEDVQQADPSDQVVIEFGSLDDETDLPTAEGEHETPSTDLQQPSRDEQPEATISFGSLDDDDDVPEKEIDDRLEEQVDLTDLIAEDESFGKETHEASDFPLDRGVSLDDRNAPSDDDRSHEDETPEVELDFTSDLAREENADSSESIPKDEHVMGSECLRFDSADPDRGDTRYTDVGDEVRANDETRIDVYAASDGFDSIDEMEGDDLHRMLAAQTLADGLENQIIVQSNLRLDEIEFLLDDIESRHEPAAKPASAPNPFEETFDNEQMIVDRNGLAPNPLFSKISRRG